MKAFLVLLTAVLVTPSAFAQKYVCTTNEAAQPQLTVVLESTEATSDTHVRDGATYPYSIAIYKSDSLSPQVDAVGTVEVEDVMFSFVSQDQNIQFQIYLDELDQSSLSIKGRADVGMTCY